MLRPFVWMGIRFFFRRVVVAGAHRVPSNRPVVIVANHQNALLDPVVLCVSSTKQLHWLTRADVFKNPLVDRFLRSINMLPVYRERDRVADLHNRNNEIFRQCYERMKSNAIIGIFPEGTHRGKKQLVPLKKGLARLVIGAYEEGVRGLCILPVGLDYESFYDPQKNLIVKFGEPIEVDAFLTQPDATHAKLHTEITEAVHEALVKLMIHIDSDDVHSEILSLKPLIDAKWSGESLMKKYEVFHKDALFRNSIRISFWTFITPLYLSALYGLLRLVGVESGVALCLWLSIPAGLITLPWWRNAKRIAHALRVRKLRHTDAFKEWMKHREQVIQWLNKIPYLKSDV